MDFDRPMMDAACGLIVLMLPGWAVSARCSHEEIEIFRAAGKPIVNVAGKRLTYKGAHRMSAALCDDCPPLGYPTEKNTMPRMSASCAARTRRHGR